ncbi:metal ABC transporter substrate-binding protein [Rhabdothermincola sp.]|uniref:metal ABC transporter substrate-binding protein n=1 Tax=Rhabdothermincola sp. TaxID=2820405 RepID=UPI002FE18706
MIGLALLVATVAVSCARSAPRTLRVLATTDIVGWLTGTVAGPSAQVTVVVPAGADPRTFTGDAELARQLDNADLVIAVGGGFERGLQPALHAARRTGTEVLFLLEDLAPEPYGRTPAYEPGPAPTGPDAPEIGAPDPSFWMDPDRAAQAARSIAAALDVRSPELAVLTAVNVDRLEHDLAAADEAVQGALAPLAGGSTLVTDDPHLGYFANRYGLSIAAPGEGRQPTDVVLYAAALGPPGSGADTLPGLLVVDARNLATALRPGT